MNTDFLKAIDQVSAERGVPAETILQAIEQALVSAYRRNYGNVHPRIDVRIDRRDGAVCVFADKAVVAEVKDPEHEISLGEALRLEADTNLGRQVEVDVTPPNFGRVAAQTARQVVVARLRDFERDQVYAAYAEREGEIVTAQVGRTEGRNVIMLLDERTEALLPPIEQVPADNYRPNQRLKVYVVSVARGPKGPLITVSRTHKNLLRRLFELEVPEVYSGVVEIRAIAREPGSRSKVAVYARQPGVDPVGSCVGQRGVRNAAIVSELSGEKVDVVPWFPDPAQFVASALSPAKVVLVELSDADKTATVIVPDRQLSLAIGREGQNARLAAKLTGWRIDIKPASSRGLDDGAPVEAVAAGVAEGVQ